jgi:transcriptional repressor NrdR
VNVIKRSGATEPFKRAKIISGVRKACQGRPVSEDDLALLAQEVEESIRAQGLAEIDANDVGLAILDPLQRLDEVAYLRFASVYQAFDGLTDFERAIENLREGSERPAASTTQSGDGPTNFASEAAAADAGSGETEVSASAGTGNKAEGTQKKSKTASQKRTRTSPAKPAQEPEDPDQPTLL